VPESGAYTNQNNNTMKFINSISIIVSAVVLSMLLAACGSDHDHGPTPVGLNLLLNGEVIASQQGNNITYPGDNDFITITEGETTGTIEVQFVLESGEPFVYDTGEGYSLEYNITNTDVLSINHPVNNNEWNVQLEGVSAGLSSFNLQLFHVSHSDFDSRSFDVEVVAPDVE
jgi:hypothetical protein